MIHHVWSVLCQSASIDNQSNSVSLQNTIEIVTVFGGPSSKRPGLISAELVSLWIREEDDTPISGQARVYYIDPDEKKADPVLMDIPSLPSPFHRTRLTLTALPVFLAGLYQFHVEFQLQGEEDWQTVAMIPILVRGQPLPERLQQLES